MNLYNLTIYSAKGTGYEIVEDSMENKNEYIFGETQRVARSHRVLNPKSDILLWEETNLKFSKLVAGIPGMENIC